MWEELGISGGTAIIILIVAYFVIKSAVKNGIKQAYRDITDDIETDSIIEELNLNDNDE